MRDAGRNLGVAARAAWLALGVGLACGSACASSRSAKQGDVRGEGDAEQDSSRLGQGLPEGPSDGAPQAPADRADEADEAPAGPELQAWLGQLRGTTHPCDQDPSEALTRLLLLLQFDGAGRLLSGSASFGDTPIDPPSGPNDTYPSHPTWQSDRCPREYGVMGFEYPVSAGARVDGGLELTIELGALWEQWCRMQPSYPVPEEVHPRPGDYACRPGDSWRFIVGNDKDLSADARCYANCECHADGCISAVGNTFELSLKPTADDMLVGTLRAPQDVTGVERSEVRLARVR